MEKGPALTVRLFDVDRLQGRGQSDLGVVVMLKVLEIIDSSGINV